MRQTWRVSRPFRRAGKAPKIPSRTTIGKLAPARYAVIGMKKLMKELMMLEKKTIKPSSQKLAVQVRHAFRDLQYERSDG